MKAWQSSIRMSCVCVAALGLVGCVAKKPPADDVWTSEQAERQPASTQAGSTCTIKGKYTLKGYRAEVSGNVSKAHFALLTTSARLEGDTVVYKHAGIDMKAGLVKEGAQATTARFTWLQYDTESSPIVDGATKLSIALHPLKVTSQGCDARSVAFGTVHLAAMITAQQANNSTM